MALKVELKPGERFILGESVITNDNQRTRLHIEGTTPMLREKDIILPEDADTPCKRVYVLVQGMYLADDPRKYHRDYFALMAEIQHAAPSTKAHFEAINNEILTGSLYKALKKVNDLIAYEGELLDHAKRGCGLQRDDKNHRRRA